MKLQIIKEERSTLGVKVRALAKSLESCHDLRTFVSNFNKELEKIKTGNHVDASCQYTAKIMNEFTNNELVQIWHRSSVASKSDTMVMQLYKQ